MNKQDFLTTLRDPLEGQVVTAIRDIEHYYGHIMNNIEYKQLDRPPTLRVFKVTIQADFSDWYPLHIEDDIKHYFARLPNAPASTLVKTVNKDSTQIEIFVSWWLDGSTRPMIDFLMPCGGYQANDPAVICAPYIPKGLKAND